MAAPAPAQLAELGWWTPFGDCADPGNMPFSNEAGEGFEQAISELFAQRLGREVPTPSTPRHGFVRLTLGERRCDMIMGYPQGDELVQNTNHYYS